MKTFSNCIRLGAFFFIAAFGLIAHADSFLWVDPGVALSRFDSIFVDVVSNDTGSRFEFDVTGALRGDLASSLRERGFAVLDSPVAAKSALTLKGQLTLYTPGSALARWVMPGLGATQAVLRASFIDTSSGEIVADMVALGYVGGGGLFSIGADRWILQRIAEEVTTALRKRQDAKRK